MIPKTDINRAIEKVLCTYTEDASFSLAFLTTKVAMELGDQVSPDNYTQTCEQIKNTLCDNYTIMVMRP